MTDRRGMEDRAEHNYLLNQLVLRVAALEDNVAFLEVWCEEQQDVLDRVGESATYWFFEEREPEPVRLRVVDLRDDYEEFETEHQRRLRQLRARIARLQAGSGVDDPVRTS